MMTHLLDRGYLRMATHFQLHAFPSLRMKEPALQLGLAVSLVLCTRLPPLRGRHRHPQSYLGSFSHGINSRTRLQNGTGSNSGPIQPRLHL